MENKGFSKNQVYENVYFIFIDASGHSNIVRRNPKDVSSQAFDLLFDKISNRLNRVTTKNRCEIAIIWSWLGDGGVIAMYDSSERTAVATSLKLVQDLFFKSQKIVTLYVVFIKHC